MTNIDNLDKWIAASKTHILFGHQSVGDNILEGVKERGIILDNLDEISIGENGDPVSKVISFSQAVTNAMNSGHPLDVAMMKFCFVDLPGSHSPQQLFMVYNHAMERLQEKYPYLKIVHFTIPLTTTRATFWTSVKTNIKKLLRKNANRNHQREQYNKMLRSKYPKEDIFDLALLESNGYIENGSPALNPHFTDDGGHLNKFGRANISPMFLTYLSNIKTTWQILDNKYEN